MSRRIIKSYHDPRIRLFDNKKNIGLTPTLNHGLRLAQTELIARQDADDISHPRRLERQIIYFQDNPNVVLAGTQGSMIDSKGNFLKPYNKSKDQVSIRWSLLFGNPFIHTSVMFRKQIMLNNYGGYDESFSYCQDYNLWSKTAESHSVNNLPYRLVECRVHSSSLTASMKKSDAEEVQSVMGQNLFSIFSDQFISKDEIDLLFRYQFKMDKDNFTSILDLFHRLLNSFKVRFPEATFSRDFQHAIGLQYAKFANRMIRINHNRAYQFYSKAIKSYPRLIFPLICPHVLSRSCLFRKLVGYQSY